MLFACPAFGAARFSVSGSNILDPNGQAFIPSGYNENYNYPGGAQNMLQHDVALMIAQGANNVRIRIPFMNVGTCGDPYYPSDNGVDAYNPNYPQFGNVDPTWWASVNQQIQWAAADAATSTKPFMIVVAFVGGNCTADFSNSTFISAYPTAEQWVAGQLLNTPGVVIEEMAEPNAPEDQVALHTLQASIATAIRTADPTVPIIVGPAPTYNARYATTCLTSISNSFCTVDLYELNDYTKNIQTGSCVVGPPNTCPSYPGYYSDRPPNSDVPSCVYPLQGQPGNSHGSYFVLFDSHFMSQGLGQCLLQFLTVNNMPIWVNQFGAYAGLPGYLQWHGDWEYFMHTNGIGGDKWVFRQAYTGGADYTYGNGNAVWWQDSALVWHRNDALYGQVGQLFNWIIKTKGRRP